MNHKIEKHIELRAPVSKVWRALTDYQQFGEWFRVQLDGPFVVGGTVTGSVLYPGYEHLTWQAVVQQIEPERLFSYTWHPYAVDPAIDYSAETPTLVEFTLKPTATGTLLTVIESGFDKIPEHRQFDALRMNDQGWNAQMKNIEHHVAAQP